MNVNEIVDLTDNEYITESDLDSDYDTLSVTESIDSISSQSSIDFQEYIPWIYNFRNE